MVASRLQPPVRTITKCRWSIKRHRKFAPTNADWDWNIIYVAPLFGGEEPFTRGYPPDGARPPSLILLLILLTKYLRFPLGLRSMLETYSNSSLAMGMRCLRIR